MDIFEIDINLLVPAEYNPRKLSAKQEKEIKRSISKFGVVEPVVVNKNENRKNVIIGGHQRVFILKKMGYKTAPCVFVDLEIEKEKELNIRLNKNTGEFDLDILLSEFEKFDLIDFGFDELELGIEDEPEKSKEIKDKEIPKKFEVIIECEDEDEQETAFNFCSEKGFKCHLLSL